MTKKQKPFGLGQISLRKHPFLLALRRGGRFARRKRGETDVFAGYLRECPLRKFPQYSGAERQFSEYICSDFLAEGLVIRKL